MCVCVCVCVYIYILSIGQVGRVITNDSEDWGSIPGLVIPKMVHGKSFLYTKHFKVRIKSKVEQSRERSHVLSNISV